MKQEIPKLEVSLPQFQELLQRIRADVGEADFHLIQSLVSTFQQLHDAYHEQDRSIRRLLQIIFGVKTERYEPAGEHSGLQKSGEGPAAAEEAAGQERIPAAPKRRGAGHGRLGADAYPGAQRITVPHESLAAGDACPECPGRLYRMSRSAVLLTLFGSPPVSAAVHELEQLRCSGCQKVFSARAPQEAGSKKFDESAAVMNALMKYGCGVPFFRLASLQKSLGIPLPEATQWKQVASLADDCKPVFGAMQKQAAAGEVVHIDDTSARILQRTRELQAAAQEGRKHLRRGTFTTAVLAQTDAAAIALYFTGSNHAGENLEKLLGDRKAGAPPSHSDVRCPFAQPSGFLQSDSLQLSRALPAQVF